LGAGDFRVDGSERLAGITRDGGVAVVRRERRQALQEALDDLQRYRKTFSRGRLLVERDLQRMVLQALYTAVQACLDEALEICRQRGLDTGSRYREAFIALGRDGVIDAELAARLADWASFRNVLAHFYPVVDMKRVWDALGEIEDLLAFQDILQQD